MKRTVFLLLLLVVLIQQANAQCVINTSASEVTITCGEEVILSTFGTGVGEVVLEENFDSGTFGPGWDATPGSVDFSNPCDPGNNTPHAWMGDNTSVPRNLESEPYDLTSATAGVSVCFDLLYATQGNAAPCEGPDEPEEGVYLEYSIDGGATWVEVEFWDPNGGEDPQLTNWNNHCVDLPAEAITASTQIRWSQTADSGQEFDHWGVDNVQILQNDINAEIEWLHDGYNYGPGSNGGENPTPVQPTQTTTYTARITTSTGDVCESDITIVVEDPFFDNDLYLDPEEVCDGDCADVLGNAVVMSDTGGIKTYENNEFSVVATGSASVNINVQGMNTQTLQDGTIQEVCINGFNYQGTEICSDFLAGGCDCNGVQIDLGDQCNFDASLFEVTLSTPDGCQMTMIPSQAITSNSITDVCFVPAATDPISTGSGDYAGTYAPDDNFNTLNGCDVNGVWTLEFDAGTGALSIGAGSLTGWSITFDDEPIYQDPTYSWSPTNGLSDPSIVNPTACPTASTTYELTVSNGVPGCATETIPLTLDVVPCNGCTPPTLDIDNLNECEPNTVDLNIAILPTSDNATITFYNSQTDAQNATNAILADVAVSGTYWIRAEDPNDPTCFRVESVDVTIDDCSTCTPPVLVINDQFTCPPNTVDLNDAVDPSSDNATITFYGSEADADAASNAIGADISTSGTYWIRAEDPSDATCYEVFSVVVDVDSGENASFSLTDFCVGDNNSATITGTQGGVFTFDPDPADGATINAQTGAITNAVAGTTYSVTYTTQGSCPASSTETVTALALPNFTVTGQDLSCGGTDGELRFEGLNSSTAYDIAYTFNGTPVSTSLTTDASGVIVITGQSAGTYANFEATLSGCSGNFNNSVVLTQQGAPTVIAPADISVCVGEEVTLTAQNPDNATSISWTNNIQDGEAFIVSQTGPVTYVVAAELDGCVGTDEVVVTGIPAPPVFAGVDRTICLGEPVILSGQGAPNLQWDGGFSQNDVLFPTETTTYVLTGTDANGCTATDEFTATVEDLPAPSFSGDQLIGCEPHQVVFSNTTQPVPSSCEWNYGDGTTSIGCDQVIKNYENPGVYDVTLTVTSLNGCQFSTTYDEYVTVTPEPIADFVADKGRLDVNDTEIEFTNTSIGGENYIWDFGDGSPTVNSVEASYEYGEEGNRSYIVTLIADNGPDCRDTARMVIRVDDVIVFYIPNSFTPDGDEFNQTFQPVFTSGFDPNDFVFTIFNRWGEIIFETRDSNKGWDGTYGGLGLVKDGTYVWTLEFKETMTDKRHYHNGHVTLIR